MNGIIFIETWDEKKFRLANQTVSYAEIIDYFEKGLATGFNVESGKLNNEFIVKGNVKKIILTVPENEIDKYILFMDDREKRNELWEIYQERLSAKLSDGKGVNSIEHLESVYKMRKENSVPKQILLP